MSPQKSSVFSSPYLLLVLPPLFWAGNTVAGRVLVDEVAMSPYALSFWRWVMALAVLAPFTLKETLGHGQTIRRHWKLIIVLGALSVGSFNVLMYVALQTTTAINASLVGATMPLAILLLSWLWLKEPFGLWPSLGLSLSISGVALVMGRGDLGVFLSLHFQIGDAFMLAAVATWAAFSVLLRAKPLNLPPMVFLTVQIAGGMVVITPIYLIDLALGGGAFPLTVKGLGLTAFTALFPALLAFAFWNRGVKAVGANVAGFYVNLVPLFTATLAALLLGEQILWYHGLGLALIFAGIGLATRRPRTPSNQAKASSQVP